MYPLTVHIYPITDLLQYMYYSALTQIITNEHSRYLYYITEPSIYNVHLKLHLPLFITQLLSDHGESARVLIGYNVIFCLSITQTKSFLLFCTHVNYVIKQKRSKNHVLLTLIKHFGYITNRILSEKCRKQESQKSVF